MKEGIDHIGVAVSFYCHDGHGNYVIHKRSDACRDEIGCWDFGGGGIDFGEKIETALYREVMEEYGVVPLEVEFLDYEEATRTEAGVLSHWISFDFKVLVDREKVINGEPKKHSELKWVTMDTLPQPLHSLVEKYVTNNRDRF